VSINYVTHCEILHILPSNDEGVRQVADSTGQSWLFYCSFRDDTLSFNVPRAMVRVLQKSWQCSELSHYTLKGLGNCLTIYSLKDSENIYPRKALSEHKMTGMHTLCCSVLQRNCGVDCTSILGMQFNSDISDFFFPCLLPIVAV
jgi:hypothetical protein